MDLDAFHKKFTRAESGIKFVADNEDDLRAMLADWKAGKQPKAVTVTEPVAETETVVETEAAKDPATSVG